MCGIIGIVSHDAVNQELYDGLTVLQHRGQDAAGIVTSDGKHLSLRRKNGLVKEAFRTSSHMRKLRGNMGIGHVRYPTAGSSSESEAQPFYVNSPYGISLAHNGNLTNSDPLKRELFEQDRRQINTESDSEVLLNIFAQELHRQNSYRVSPDDIFKAVAGVHDRCRGAYAVVAMITRDGIVGFRDPNGIRPLTFGSRKTEKGMDYMIASESTALVTQGYKIERDIKPGEAIYITLNGEVHTRQCSTTSNYSTCLFEYVYFARPDSVIDNVFVHKARMRMGHKLAEKIQNDWKDHDIDVVIPIPDTSRTSALEMAMTLDVSYREGFIKNRYIGRTFIMPGQGKRKKSVRQKLNPIDLEFKGKNVMLVDDSIVRGTTSKEIVQMVRDSGAKNVYFASASPPVRFPNIYGIDMPAASELIAHGRTEQEIAEHMGVDRLIYQSLEDLKDSITEGNPELTEFDCSVFNGEYVTGEGKAYFTELQKLRGNSSKKKKKNRAPVDLCNSQKLVSMQALPAYSQQLTNHELLLELKHSYPNYCHSHILLINIQHQRLYQIKDQTLLREYVISSAANGAGNKENSGKTPLGAHLIREKFGDNVVLGTQFKARQSTGYIPPILIRPEQSSDGDYITSRILWLGGLETGYNQGEGVDSYHRYIYIHGTDEEGRLGTPASHGCIRMANKDIIDLYTEVNTETLVYIFEK